MRPGQTCWLSDLSRTVVVVLSEDLLNATYLALVPAKALLPELCFFMLSLTTRLPLPSAVKLFWQCVSSCNTRHDDMTGRAIN